MVSFFVIFLNDKKITSHIDQINEHMNPTNYKINSYDKTRKMIVDLCSNKGNNNENSSTQLSCLHS